MATSALRLMTCAGALATALLLSGVTAPMAIADPDESTSSSDGASAPGNPEENSGSGAEGSAGGAESKPDNEPPPSQVGNGREDNDKKPAEKPAEDEEQPATGWGGWPKFKHSLSIPVLRVPTPEEVAAAGWPTPELFFGTVDVPVPSIDGFLSTFSQPSPDPTPSPSFRTQQEAPVLDVTGNGGGLDPMASESAPPVYQLPLVAAPVVPIPGFSPGAPLATAAAGGPPVASAPGAAAGVRAPVIQGTVSPRTEVAEATMTPMSGQATRVGYSRYMTNPTMTQLAAVALPGVAGLMFLTFGGGVIGYRQANSIRFIRATAAERFLQ